jgi:hypothetical protein
MNVGSGFYRPSEEANIRRPAEFGTGALSGGSADFTTSALPGATNAIKAVYGGDSNFASSRSSQIGAPKCRIWRTIPPTIEVRWH